MSSELEQTFAALADPTRLEVVRLLGQGAMRSSEVATALALSRPTTSRHLQTLRRAGVVEETGEEDDARVRRYRLRRERFGEIRDWLEEVEAFWGEQLAAFKAHAEKKRRRP